MGKYHLGSFYGLLEQIVLTVIDSLFISNPLKYQPEKTQKTLNQIKILQTEVHLLLNTEDTDYLCRNASIQITAVFEKQNKKIQKQSDQIDVLLLLIQNSAEEEVDAKMSMIKESTARMFYDEWKKIKWKLSFSD